LKKLYNNYNPVDETVLNDIEFMDLFIQQDVELASRIMKANK